MTRTSKIVLWMGIVLLVAVFVVGYHLGGRGKAKHGADEAATEKKEPEWWYCSMHPHIRQQRPGICSICNMDLVPMEGDQGDDLGPRELRLSEAARKLTQIEVTPVTRQFVEAKVRMVGKVEYDETRLSHITAWVPGRLDRLYIDYTGIAVNKGDHMVSIYSPEVLTAEEELLQALKAVKELEKSTDSIVKESVKLTVDAAREKLRLWGLNAEQVALIERTGKVSDHITIYAPVGGIVVQKHAFEGMYVKTGMRIYTIADLSQVWVKLDAYESDLAWLRYGQTVEFSTEAHQGEVFEGSIVFIDPTLNEKTRTVKVRVNVANTQGKLKPGMFVRATVRSKIAGGGKAMAPELHGKWIGPMHPEIVRDKPGDCPICGMPLVKAEEHFETLGADQAKAPLVIPASAPLITGKRAVVYVQDPTRAGVYAGREIALGPRAGNFYLVGSGLAEGELVVTNGNFKIDSALQIMAKPSMMSPKEEAPPSASNVPAAFLAQTKPLFNSYFELQQAFSKDQLEPGRKAAAAIKTGLAKVDMSLLAGDAHDAWMGLAGKIDKSAESFARAKDIDWARGQFDRLSAAMIALSQQLGTGLDHKVYQMRCPMAFDDAGADWLQTEKTVANPYFGAAMSRCGNVVEEIK